MNVNAKKSTRITIAEDNDDDEIEQMFISPDPFDGLPFHISLIHDSIFDFTFSVYFLNSSIIEVLNVNWTRSLLLQRNCRLCSNLQMLEMIVV